MALEKPDMIAVVIALAAHAGIAYAMAHVPERPPPRPSWVDVAARKNVPPPLPPPKLEPPPPPKVEKKKKPPPPPPMANEKPPEPPKEPPKPVFGATMSSTTEGD